MTTDAFFKQVSRWREMLLLGGLLSAFVSFGVAVIFSGIMALYGDSLRAASREWLGIHALSQQISEINGDNRVTRQPEGVSYVREPVIIGEPFVLILHIGRTDIGAACILREIIPLFVDDYGSTFAGNPRRPAQQLGNEVVRRELSLDLPSQVRPGRVTLTLQLEYTCGEQTLFETTLPVGFNVEALP